MTEVILSALGVYAVTLIVSSYSGPMDVLARLRSSLPVQIRDMVNCFTCLAVWVSLLFALLVGLDMLEYFAVLGGAILADELRG